MRLLSPHLLRRLESLPQNPRVNLNFLAGSLSIAHVLVNRRKLGMHQIVIRTLCRYKLQLLQSFLKLMRKAQGFAQLAMRFDETFIASAGRDGTPTKLTPRSAADHVNRVPPNLPIGVRTAPAR